MTDAEKRAADAAEAERRRVAEIMRQINEIDQKIREANKVKGTLSNCKSSLDSEIESWKNVRTALNSDVRYTQIVTTDVFEGEMADGDGNVCIAYESGKWWHYRETEDGGIEWW